MALIFPASPTLNQTYTSGSTVWTWQGTTWAKTSTAYIADGSITTVKIADLAVTSPKLATAVTNSIAAGGGGIKITSIVVTDSSYTNLDDTALDTAGGYIKIIGTGFASGCQVLVNQVPATSTTFVSSTEIRAQLPSTIAGTYVVYVANTDGSVGIRINGITFSATPTWTTSSSLPSSVVSSAISIQLVATLATTYTLTSGSTLPAGLTLSSGGLLSGSVIGIASETTYSFSIIATDTELQDSPRTFSITIIVGDPYFSYTTLLLSGNGTNNAQNNTFVDSSTNNFAITRTGTPTQGTFSPFSQTGWSGYFKGSGDKIVAAASTDFNFGTGDFTIQMMVYPTATIPTYSSAMFLVDARVSASWYIFLSSNALFFGDSAGAEHSGGAISINTWSHIVVSRVSGTTKGFINGSQAFTFSDSGNYVGTPAVTFGGRYTLTTADFIGYISNISVQKGTGVASFTIPILPLTTSATNQVLLSCSTYSFKDTNTTVIEKTITVAGTPSIQAFSPFASVGAYSAATNGGSIYFSGTSTASIETMLTVPASASFNFLASASFTIEGWINPKQIQNYSRILCINSTYTTNAVGININPDGKLVFYSYNVANPLLQSNSAIPFNTWTHIAICRSNTTFTMFINGIAQTSTYTSASALFNNSNPYITIGCGDANVGGFSPFTGYISSIRIMTSALYIANFTPSTTPLTAVANTSLLLSGTNAGIIDSTAKNLITTVGDAKISTTQSKFGGSSLSFDGTGDYLTFSTSPNLQFGTGNFTVECWSYYNNFTSFDFILDQRPSSVNGAYVTIYSASGIPCYYVNTANQITGNALSINTWYHIAISRSGSSTKMFINGVQVGSTYTDTNNYLGGPILLIGGSSYTIGDASFNGYIDDLRITKGYARYTANFTPPVSQSQGQ